MNILISQPLAMLSHALGVFAAFVVSVGGILFSAPVFAQTNVRIGSWLVSGVDALTAVRPTWTCQQSIHCVCAIVCMIVDAFVKDRQAIKGMSILVAANLSKSLVVQTDELYGNTLAVTDSM